MIADVLDKIEPIINLLMDDPLAGVSISIESYNPTGNLTYNVQAIDLGNVIESYNLPAYQQSRGGKSVHRKSFRSFLVRKKDLTGYDEKTATNDKIVVSGKRYSITSMTPLYDYYEFEIEAM